MEEKRRLGVPIEKGYRKINFFTMREKKATGNYNRKKAIIRSTFSQWRKKRGLVVTIEKGYHNDYLFLL